MRSRKTARPWQSIQREFLTLGSRYALEVADPQDALLALCVVLAIDCCDEEHSG